jgi:hypothetical protein
MNLQMWESYKDYFTKEDAIRLKSIRGRNRIVNIIKKDNGFCIEDGCDGHFKDIFSKQDMLKIIEEIKEFINN